MVMCVRLLGWLSRPQLYALIVKTVPVGPLIPPEVAETFRFLLRATAVWKFLLNSAAEVQQLTVGPTFLCISAPCRKTCQNLVRSLLFLLDSNCCEEHSYTFMSLRPYLLKCKQQHNATVTCPSGNIATVPSGTCKNRPVTGFYHVLPNIKFIRIVILHLNNNNEYPHCL